MSFLICAEGVSLAVTLAVSLVLAAAICLVLAETIYFRRRFKNLKYAFGKQSPKLWSPKDEFDPSDVAVVKKDPEKDFVILAFPDIQVWEPFRLGKKYVIYNTIKNTVEKTNPDMIVLLGDNAFYYSRQCCEKITKIMEEIGLPWAPVFGNHDFEGNADLAELGDIFMKGEHCLFKKGPRNLFGEGNYAVNIEQDGKIIHTLFFFDTGSGAFSYDESKVRYVKATDLKDKSPAFYKTRIHEGDHKGQIRIGEDWGAFSYDQIQYYKWLLAGIAKENGGTLPESTLFCHVAPYEFNDAYFEWLDSGCDPEKGFGEVNVKIGSAPVSTGMFDAIQEEGSTKNVVVGHEHENDLSVLYKGVRLSYAVKCGDECTAYAERLNGGSTLTIDKDGRGIKYENVHVPLCGKRHYDKMLWYYYNLEQQEEKKWTEIEEKEAKNGK